MEYSHCKCWIYCWTVHLHSILLNIMICCWLSSHAPSATLQAFLEISASFLKCWEMPSSSVCIKSWDTSPWTVFLERKWGRKFIISCLGNEPHSCVCVCWKEKLAWGKTNDRTASGVRMPCCHHLSLSAPCCLRSTITLWPLSCAPLAVKKKMSFLSSSLLKKNKKQVCRQEKNKERKWRLPRVKKNRSQRARVTKANKQKGEQWSCKRGCWVFTGQQIKPSWFPFGQEWERGHWAKCSVALI